MSDHLDRVFLASLMERIETVERERDEWSLMARGRLSELAACKAERDALIKAARHVAWEAEGGEVTDSSLTILLELLPALSDRWRREHTE